MSRSIYEYKDIAIKLIRGLFYKHKFDQCGKLLRVGKGAIILRKNCHISLGDKLQIHKHAKLSAWGTDFKAVLKIGSETAIGDRT